MDQSAESKQEKDEGMSKVELKYSSKSFRTVKEIYANLIVILGIVIVALLFAKYIRRGF